MGWTDKMVEDLRKMWKEGLTTGEIGKRLGVSKNSIVGKVHRLGLSGRPSPIKKKVVTEDAVATEKNIEAKSPEPKAKEVQPVKAAKEEKHRPQIKAEVRHEEIESVKIEPKFEPRKDGKIMVTHLDNHTCRWPIGDPKDENFHFCGKKIRIGQTYCDEHAALAYVKPNSKK